MTMHMRVLQNATCYEETIYFAHRSCDRNDLVKPRLGRGLILLARHLSKGCISVMIKNHGYTVLCNLCTAHFNEVVGYRYFRLL